MSTAIARSSTPVAKSIANGDTTTNRNITTDEAEAKRLRYRKLWKKVLLFSRANSAFEQGGLPSQFYSWGANGLGQLGQGNLNGYYQPVIVDYFRGVDMSVAALGGEFGLAVTATGMLYSFGSNKFGQLGIGSRDAEAKHVLPTVVETLRSKKIVKVACGEAHALAVTDSGDLYAWGCGDRGQLGLGDTGFQVIPRRVEFFEGKTIVEVACGAGHSAAITDKGRLYVWGWGEYGQLGLGDTENQLLPRWLEFLSTKRVTKVACGEVHTVALTANGEVYTWGCGEDGRLGHTAFGTCLFPTKVVIPELQNKHISLIAAGNDFTVFVADTGEVYSCGLSDEGQAGHGLKKAELTPRQIKGLQGSLIVAISCGYCHTVAVSDKGEVWAWGSNSDGQLGIGRPFPEALEPKKVTLLKNKNIQRVVCGGNMSICISGNPIILPPNIFTCGEGKTGCLGHEKTINRSVFSAVPDMKGLKVVACAAGNGFTAAVCDNGDLYTWGTGTGGVLGHGDENTRNRPTLVAFMKKNFKKIVGISCGSQHILTLTDIGDVFSWGNGKSGELGHGNTESLSVPKFIAALEGKGTIQIACGWNFSAVLTDSGDVMTWGDGTFGMLGHGSTESVLVPTLVKELTGKMIKKISCGRTHACALSENGELYSWGYSNCGQLGHGDTKMQLVPKIVQDFKNVKVVDVVCGSSHTVVLTEKGEVWTFGYGNSGRLGHGDSKDQLRPKRIDSLAKVCKVSRIFSSCTAFHTFALTETGSVYCWGYGKSGCLGNGYYQNEKGPVLLPSLEDREVKAVVCGSKHSILVIAPSTLAVKVRSSAGGNTAAAATTSDAASADADADMLLTRAEVQRKEAEIKQVQEKLERLLARNRELREELDDYRAHNKRLSGADLDSMNVKELEELKDSFFKSLKKIDMTKHDKMRDEIREKERQQIKEMEKVYHEILKKLQEQEKRNRATLVGLKKRNKKLSDKVRLIEEQLARIAKEVKTVPDLKDKVAEKAAICAKLEEKQQKIEMVIEGLMREIEQENQSKAYLDRRLKSLQEEHVQIEQEMERSKKILDELRARCDLEDRLHELMTRIQAAAGPEASSVQQQLYAGLTDEELDMLEQFHREALQMVANVAAATELATTATATTATTTTNATLPPQQLQQQQQH